MKNKILNEKQSNRFTLRVRGRDLPYVGRVSIPNKTPRVGWVSRLNKLPHVGRVSIPNERSRLDSTPNNQPLRKRIHPALAGLGVLLLANLACRPVLTIGWQEIGILILLLAILLGPALFRLARRWEEFRTWKDKKDKQPPGD